MDLRTWNWIHAGTANATALCMALSHPLMMTGKVHPTRAVFHWTSVWGPWWVLELTITCLEKLKLYSSLLLRLLVLFWTLYAPHASLFVPFSSSRRIVGQLRLDSIY